MRSMKEGDARSADCAEGIGVAQALEPVSVRLCALFHLLAGFQQLVDAGEEFGEVFCACEVWDRAFVRDARADACDLAAAHGDPETERVFGVEDDEFDLETDGGVRQEFLEPVVVVRDVHELDDALAYGLGALRMGSRGKRARRMIQSQSMRLTIRGHRPRLIQKVPIPQIAAASR